MALCGLRMRSVRDFRPRREGTGVGVENERRVSGHTHSLGLGVRLGSN